MQYPRFLTQEIIDTITENYQTPVYVYSEKDLRDRAREFLAFPSAFGHTVRYAMKANPQRNILKIFDQEGLYIDASSDYEALRALNTGITPSKIQVSSQELGKHMYELIEKWVFFVATSLHQLEYFGKHFPGKSCGIRVNPWVSSWAFAKISTGGRTSSFGIWHEKISEVQEIAQKYDITITKLHFHIWSENTPESWVDSAKHGFSILEKIPTIDIFDMGGWHKMWIMPEEKTADLQAIWEALSQIFQDFYTLTGRKIHLEMEPGKYLTINACSMITQVQDIVNTWEEGYSFLKINSGMNDMPRVAMYGVQEPLFIIPSSSHRASSTQGQNSTSEFKKYAVVGHCCESSDLLTCKLYEPEVIEPRTLREAQIWDYLIVDGVGAYNSGMAIKNYNSFPESWELLLRESWEIVEIRKTQDIKDIWKNEIEVI